MNDAFAPLEWTPPARPRRTGRWIAAALVLLLLLAGTLGWIAIGTYNQLQFNEARLGFTWHQVINQYTRRADLVPNLVKVVAAYAKHETALFGQIEQSRQRVSSLAAKMGEGGDAELQAQLGAAQSALSKQLGRLLVVAESYPQLQAAPLYQDLLVQLEGTENRVTYAREQYFSSLADYNLGLLAFPGNLLAPRLGMRARQPAALADDRVVRPAPPLAL